MTAYFAISVPVGDGKIYWGWAVPQAITQARLSSGSTLARRHHWALPLSEPQLCAKFPLVRSMCLLRYAPRVGPSGPLAGLQGASNSCGISYSLP